MKIPSELRIPSCNESFVKAFLFLSTCPITNDLRKVDNCGALSILGLVRVKPPSGILLWLPQTDVNRYLNARRR